MISFFTYLFKRRVMPLPETSNLCQNRLVVNRWCQSKETVSVGWGINSCTWNQPLNAYGRHSMSLACWQTDCQSASQRHWMMNPFWAAGISGQCAHYTSHSNVKKGLQSDVVDTCHMTSPLTNHKAGWEGY